MYETLSIAIQVIGLYLMADLLGGLFHWAEDTLGDVDGAVWGKIFVRPNVIHHDLPSQMIRINWLKNNIPIFTATAIVLGTAVLFDAITWQLLVFAAFAGMNQQVHRFAHAPRQKLPGFVKELQRVGIIQGARHHWKHHTSPHLTHYCVLTPWMNPVLDKIGFWRGLERVFVPIFGAPRRPDLMSRPWYRG